MINIIEDIKKIIKNDDLHDVEINISASGIVVYLSYRDYDGKIPIKFDNADYEIYIPKENLTSDIGVADMNIIKNIMDYLFEYMSKLDEICTGFSVLRG